MMDNFIAVKVGRSETKPVLNAENFMLLQHNTNKDKNYY
jgi:hypothetical protein